MRFIVLTEMINLAGHRMKRGQVVDVPEGMPRLDALMRSHQLAYYDGSERTRATVQPEEITV